eukprot:31281_1
MAAATKTCTTNDIELEQVATDNDISLKQMSSISARSELSNPDRQISRTMSISLNNIFKLNSSPINIHQAPSQMMEDEEGSNIDNNTIPTINNPTSNVATLNNNNNDIKDDIDDYQYNKKQIDHKFHNHFQNNLSIQNIDYSVNNKW